jgi:hypothetical protein
VAKEDIEAIEVKMDILVLKVLQEVLIMDADLLMGILEKKVEMVEIGDLMVEILPILEMVELPEHQFQDLIIQQLALLTLIQLKVNISNK